MNLLINFSIILFIMGVLVFILNCKHLLSMLLKLEYIILSLFIYLYLYLSFMEFEFYFSMLFLTFSACEGSLGISILIAMIRTHSNDYFQSFNVI